MKAIQNLLAKLIILAGLVLLVISLIWWQQTFGFRTDFIKCLAFSNGVCSFKSLGKLFGETPYTPFIFWAGIICVIVGGIFKRKK